jgi:hypothetical protein
MVQCIFGRVGLFHATLLTRIARYRTYVACGLGFDTPSADCGPFFDVLRKRHRRFWRQDT